ncbi:MAG: carboxy-S-adenosyl-L-methionine synthase CmoA [Pseudomonadota bacterium]
MPKDTLFNAPGSGDQPFRFDARVAEVFDDMISRSVPGYAEALATVRAMAAARVPDGGRCFDLGCSLGAATHAICHGLEHRPAEVIGVDNSEAMIARCMGDPAFQNLPQTVRFVEQDLTRTEITDASLVVLNYTLQFVPPGQRRHLVARIFEGLLPGGVLVISEKFRFENAAVQDLMTTQHLDFKRSNGYTELEIAGKRNALEDVLIADTRARHVGRLETSGFRGVTLWQAHLNFGTFVAFKPGG